MYDFAIIGGGIIGLSTAMAIRELHPKAKLAIFEKESSWACHQTGHNSGVIHSGIYYKPGSFKARFARQGNESMVRFCETYGIPYETCGKLIVATTKDELPLLDHLYKRGIKNELEVEKLSIEQMREIEPNVDGLAGI